MTRNQKIALGCGGAGCLGLIVLAIAGCVIYFLAYRTPYSTNRNFNISTNRNSNSNDDLTTNGNDNTNSSSSSSSSASSMSDDDKHKLYQAALLTGDTDVIQRVSVKLGLMDDDNMPRPGYQDFVQEHGLWIIQNVDFNQTVNTPEKARAYVDANLPE